MILNPKVGSQVQIWYRKALSEIMPYHGEVGTVIIASRGKPRNHGIMLERGVMVSVPCGNIRKID